MRRVDIPRVPLEPPLARQLALLLAAARVAIGASALLAPGLLGRPWIGPEAQRPGARLLARGLGGRDLALGLGALLAAKRSQPLRGWVEAGALADLGDAGATLATFARLPRLTRWLVLATTIGAGAAGGLAATVLEQPGA